MSSGRATGHIHQPTIHMSAPTTFQLFLGRNIPINADRLGVTRYRVRYGSPVVSDSALQAWLRQHVDPQFPGYTLTDALGYWRGEAEDCAVLMICTDNVAGVHRVARSYKDTFFQEAVGLIELPAMQFI